MRWVILTDLDVIVHLFHAHNSAFIVIFAIFELFLMQHQMNCEQFCPCNITAFGGVCMLAERQEYSDMPSAVDQHSVV